MDSDSESSIEEEKVIHCSCGGKFRNNKTSHVQHIKTQKHQKHLLDQEPIYMSIEEVEEEKEHSRPRSENISEE